MRMVEILFVSVTAFCLIGCEAVQKDTGKVTVSVVGPTEGSLGAYRNHEGHPTRAYRALMKNEVTRFEIQQWVDVDASHAPKVLPLEGMIGLTQPAVPNWYGNGFLNIMVGNEMVGTAPIKAVRAAEEGERGVVQMDWERPEGTWRVTFLVLPRGKSLLCSVRYFPGKKPAEWSLRLVCYPGKTSRDGERAVTTAKRTAKQEAKVELDPSKEWWVAYYDNVYDFGVSNSEGGGALIYAPEDVASARVEVSKYPVVTILKPKPEAREVRMIFWDYFFGMKNRQIVDNLRWTAGDQLKQLRRTSFVNRAVFSEDVAARQREIERLLKSLGNPPDKTKEAKALAEKLAALRRRLAETRSEAKPSDEADFVNVLAQHEKLLWDLRWEDLLKN